MNWVDSLVFIIVLLSLGLAFAQGLLRSLLSFASGLVSVMISLIFFLPLSWLLTDLNPSTRLLTAFIFLFSCSFLLMVILSYLILQAYPMDQNTVTERSLAAMFGLARGGLIVYLLAFTAYLLNLSHYQWWQQSFLIQSIEPSFLSFSSGP